jgi:ATP synthase protein I
MTPKPNNNFSFKGVALKTSTDMLAAIVVGAGLGVAFDKYVDSYPWGLIIGFILGSVAGLLNVYRGLCKIGFGFGSKKPDKKDLNG